MDGLPAPPCFFTDEKKVDDRTSHEKTQCRRPAGGFWIDSMATGYMPFT
jgi:hypothetical protein